MISEATIVVYAVLSTCQVWKQFLRWFISGQRLSFPWWFLSPLELFALSTPRVSCGSSFGDDFWHSNISVFYDDFWAHRSCLHFWIHASTVEALRWWFISRQRLSFHWWFLNPKELFALTNPRVSSGVAMSWSHKLITLASNTTHKIV